MEHARAHVMVSGYVQGVFYRANTKEIAEMHKLKGWVRNTPGGGVEAVFEGEKENVEYMVQWCRKGPAGAQVQAIDVQWEKPTGEFNRFSVRY